MMLHELVKQVLKIYFFYNLKNTQIIGHIDSYQLPFNKSLLIRLLKNVKCSQAGQEDEEGDMSIVFPNKGVSELTSIHLIAALERVPLR